MKKILIFLIALGFVSTANASTRHTTPVRAPAIVSVPGTITGFSTHPPTTNLTAYYNELLATGANSQRTDLLWDGVQSSATSYTWSRYDTMVNTALSMGISTTFIIDETPSFAKNPACTSQASQCAPTPTALAQFCSAAAQHFNGKVSTFEVWNEENNNGNWEPAASPADYVAALNACTSAIKAVNSNDKIIFGGLAPGANISITDFVTQAYQHAPQFDIMGQHPYSYPWGLNEGDATNNGWQAMLAVRQIMNTNGDTAKPIWITEVGAPTCGSGSALNLGDDGSSNYPYLSLTGQAQLASNVGSAAKALGITHVFWYTLVNQNSNNNSTNENCFGVYYTNGTAKPIVQIIK